MAGRPSPLTLAALAAVAKGVPPYRAALTAGVSPSTVYRALARVKAAVSTEKTEKTSPQNVSWGREKVHGM